MMTDPADTTPRLTPPLRRRILAARDLDARTLRRWERGLPVRPSSEARIHSALRELGIATDHHDGPAAA